MRRAATGESRSQRARAREGGSPEDEEERGRIQDHAEAGHALPGAGHELGVCECPRWVLRFPLRFKGNLLLHLFLIFVFIAHSSETTLTILNYSNEREWCFVCALCDVTKYISDFFHIQVQ